MHRLPDREIAALKEQAHIEVDRDIYYVDATSKEIIINGDWSIKRGKKGIKQDVIAAIEAYCTRENINWEYECAYSAWAD